MPFWSPDSQSIGFFAGGVLKRIDVNREFVRTSPAHADSRRRTWTLTTRSSFGSLVSGPSSVAARVAPMKEATRLLPGQTNHRSPVSPGGNRFSSHAGAPDVRGRYLGSLGGAPVSGNRRPGIRVHVHVRRLHVLLARKARYGRGPDRGLLSEGDFIPVAPRVFVSRRPVALPRSPLVDRSHHLPRVRWKTQLVWLDRPVTLSRAWTTVTIPALDGRVSPMDGRWLMIAKLKAIETCGSLTCQRGAPRRLTFDEER